jgi:hypothetical protein
MTTSPYLTRSEIFAAGWRPFRSIYGQKATPRQRPHYWATCLRMAWGAAKGGEALELSANRFDIQEEARQRQDKPASALKQAPTERRRVRLIT